MSSRKIEYTLEVTYLLNSMQKVSSNILEKKYEGYKSDYEFLRSELYLSDEDAENELTYIYSSCEFKDYNDELMIIEKISKDILDNYEPDDFYEVTKKEFFTIFLKKYD